MGPNAQNSSYVDIHLEGNEDGWVAIGFSTDKRMVGVVITKYTGDGYTIQGMSMLFFCRRATMSWGVYTILLL